MRGMASAMPRSVIRPTGPQAIMIAIGAAAVLIFGIVQMIIVGDFHYLFALWIAAGLVVIALAVRAIHRTR